MILKELCAKVLVVDDDAHEAETLKVLLEAEGHECATANTGQQAIEYCRRERFDCMLLDHSLANGVSGLAVAQRLGGHSSAIRPTYVLLMTRYARESFDTAIREGLIEGHLPKPVTIELLREHVSRSLRFNGHGRGRQLGARGISPDSQPYGAGVLWR